MSLSRASNKDPNFTFSLRGEVKRGVLWSERTISIKNNQLTYNKKASRDGVVLFTIDKYVVTQNMNLESNMYTFKIYEKTSKSFMVVDSSSLWIFAWGFFGFGKMGY